jgi:hypothetical protein
MDRTQQETIDLIASLPKERRLNKMIKILSLKDGTTINSRVHYLIDYCKIDAGEVFNAVAEAANAA